MFYGLERKHGAAERTYNYGVSPTHSEIHSSQRSSEGVTGRGGRCSLTGSTVSHN